MPSRKRLVASAVTAAALATGAGAATAGAAPAPGPKHNTMPCSPKATWCVQETGGVHGLGWYHAADGTIVGPLPLTVGTNGSTPPGTYHVTWKDKDHRSHEDPGPDGQGARMPFSVFFDHSGRASHVGSLNKGSAGCIHLRYADAKHVFDAARVGDRVDIIKK